MASASQAVQWRTLRLSAVNDIVRVAVDGAELLALVDDAPLPPGSVAVTAAFPALPDGVDPSQNSLLVDDVLVSVPTADLPPTLTPTATLEAAVPTPPPVETATATSTSTQEPLPPEPILTPIFTDNFDGGTSMLWTLGEGWSYVPNEGGLALEGTISNEPVTFANNDILDAAVQVRFQISAGAAQLSTRVSEAGRYTASLDINGQISLYRDDLLLGSAAIAPLTPGAWYTLRLSAFADVIRVSINGGEVLAVSDPQALPAGTVQID